MRAVVATISLLSAGLLFVGCDDSVGDTQNASSFEFANFRVANLGETRVDIRFDTSVATDCVIEFGTSMELGQEATDPDMEEGELALEHDVPLEDFDPATQYYYRARATDIDGLTAYSDIRSFETSNADDPTAGKTNFALLREGTTITEVSSNYGNGSNASTWGIDNAFDGSMASEWSSNGDGDDAFVEIDFGQLRHITGFAYRSRKMNDGTSITKSLRLVIDGAVVGPLAVDNPDERYVFAIDPVDTRSVRIEYVSSTGGNTGAKEIEFY